MNKQNVTIDKNTVYLVTGAAGFLGSNICTQLLSRGNRVRALVLPGEKAAKYVPKEVEICEGDLRSPEALDRFFTVPFGCSTIVIHCASSVSVSEDYNQKIMDVNVGGTKNIIDFCLDHRECQKLIYVSSTGAIPELPKGQPIKEVSHFSGNDVRGCYSQSKALATQAVLDAVQNQGLNACVVHPSGILGPGDYSLSESTGTILRVLQGELSMGMRGGFNLCDVRDLAAGTIAAADRGSKGGCYILGNEEVSFKELCRILSAESGCKPVKFFLPLGLAEILAKHMEKKAKKAGTKPLITSFSVYSMARNNTYDCAKAKEELGYRTRSYSQTIRDEVAWFMSAGLLNGYDKKAA